MHELHYCAIIFKLHMEYYSVTLTWASLSLKTDHWHLVAIALASHSLPLKSVDWCLLAVAHASLSLSEVRITGA